MIAVYRIVALVCVALVIAVATFVDRFALAIGGVGIVIAIFVLALVFIGAGLSLRRHDQDIKRNALVDTQSEQKSKGDSTRSTS